MLSRISLLLFAVFLTSTVTAQSLSLEELAGVWNYTYYADVESPDNKIPVGAQMEFFENGTVITTMSTGSAEATYTLDGETIIYVDANGRQEWSIQSYEPGKSLVVEYNRALIFFERPDVE